MSVDRGRRIGAGAGILSALVTAAGFIIATKDMPKADDLTNQYHDYLVNHRSAILTGVCLIGLGYGLFLLFLGALRNHLADRGVATAGSAAATGDRTLTNATILGGSVGAALLLAGAAALNAGAFHAAELAGQDDVTTRFAVDLGNDLLAMSAFPFAVFFVGAGLAALENGSLARPLALAALPLAVLNLVGGVSLFDKSGFLANGGAFAPIVGLLSTLWVLGAAVVMFRDASRAGTTRVVSAPVA